MTKNKDAKRDVRARMKKTGESYTAARAQVVRANPPKSTWPTLAGMSDDAVHKKTGKTWAEWVKFLDDAKATSKTHAEIAKHVKTTHPEIGGWWSQGVTVAYERIRGLREVGQRRETKTFSASKSKTFPVPIGKLYRAFSQKRTREKWIDGDSFQVRTSTVDKSMRVTWDKDTSVHLYFVSKSAEKSSVAIEHVGHAKKKDADAAKVFWGEQLSRLAATLK